MLKGLIILTETARNINRIILNLISRYKDKNIWEALLDQAYGACSPTLCVM